MLIPVFNEASTVEEVLTRVLSVPIDLEIIVVDDGSTDGSYAILQKAEKLAGRSLRVFSHKRNRGKGAAIRTAIPHARGKYTIIQDADLELNPMDYVPIIGKLRTEGIDVVFGSRFLEGRPDMPLLSLLANRLLVWLVRVLYGVKITDEATCYKAFETPFLKGLKLNCQHFDFDPEVTALIILNNLTIAEVPIRYLPRTRSEGKKITWVDGMIAAWTLVKIRLSVIRSPCQKHDFGKALDSVTDPEGNYSERASADF
ncbi:MAG: glycosyltransferase family 2 protein [Armatimonadota bacterium]